MELHAGELTLHNVYCCVHMLRIAKMTGRYWLLRWQDMHYIQIRV